MTSSDRKEDMACMLHFKDMESTTSEYIDSAKPIYAFFFSKYVLLLSYRQLSCSSLFVTVHFTCNKEPPMAMPTSINCYQTGIRYREQVACSAVVLTLPNIAMH